MGINKINIKNNGDSMNGHLSVQTHDRVSQHGRISQPYPKYKNSNIPWLGEIPENWVVASCKHVLDIPITDGPHTTPELLESGIPFISAEAVKNGRIDFNKKRGYISQSDHSLFSKKYIPKRGDIYMVKSGATTGNIAKVETDLEFSIWSPLAVFRADTKLLNPNFLFYTLQSKYFKQGVELHWSFGTQQNIGMGVLSNLPITFGNISEQTTIARFLDYKMAKINRFIQKKKQLIKLLNEQKAAIINQAVTKGLDANVKMKDSGIEWLGEIPEHWEVRKLSTIITSAELGGNYDSSGVSDGIPVMKMGNLDRSIIKLSRVEYLKKDSIYETRHILNYGDFLFNTRNSADLVGKVALWRNELPLSLYNSNILRISFKEGVNNEYMNYLFNSHAMLNFLKLIAKGTTNVSAIYYKDLSKVDIWLPNTSEQKDIINTIEKETTIINTAISKIEKELALTEEYKTALIAEAVTGKIDVRGYEVPEISEEETYEEIEEEISITSEDAEAYQTVEE